MNFAIIPSGIAYWEPFNAPTQFAVLFKQAATMF